LEAEAGGLFAFTVLVADLLCLVRAPLLAGALADLAATAAVNSFVNFLIGNAAIAFTNTTTSNSRSVAPAEVRGCTQASTSRPTMRAIAVRIACFFSIR
jgi:hypothetical protein